MGTLLNILEKGEPEGREDSDARTVQRHDNRTLSIVAVEDIPAGGRTRSRRMEDHRLLQEGSGVDCRSLGHRHWRGERSAGCDGPRHDESHCAAVADTESDAYDRPTGTDPALTEALVTARCSTPVTALPLTGAVTEPWLVETTNVDGYEPAVPGSKSTDAVTDCCGASTVPTDGRPVTR